MFEKQKLSINEHGKYDFSQIFTTDSRHLDEWIFFCFTCCIKPNNFLWKKKRTKPGKFIFEIDSKCVRLKKFVNYIQRK